MEFNQTAQLIFAVDESANAALQILETDEPNVQAAAACLRSALGALAVLAGMMSLLTPDEESGPATDDPETCSHPEVFELPGQIMCQSCGASKVEGSWAVL